MRFQDYHKSLNNLRGWLEGRDYTEALRAVELGLAWHRGSRKDGNPEFSHQVAQMQYARTIETNFVDPEGILICVALHDLGEDYPEAWPLIEEHFPEHIPALRVLDKTGKKTGYYYDQIGQDSYASVIKGLDRWHNFQSMLGPFTIEKQKEYVIEAETYILPMLKSARKRFPEQKQAYHNVYCLLNMQIEMIRCIHEALAEPHNGES